MDLIWNGNRLLVPGGNLHIIYNPISEIPLVDRDGNIYTTIIVGTQEWTVENLRTTKYGQYSVPIQNVTVNSSPNLFSSWTNGTTTAWNTFTSSGLDITSAIESAGTYGNASTNLVSFSTGDHIYVFYNLKMISGTKPTIGLLDSSGVEWASWNMNVGEHYADFTIPVHAPDTWKINLKSSNTGTNCSLATNIILDGGTTGWAQTAWGAYCYYNNSSETGETYGCLYNWYATQNQYGLAYFERNGVQESGWRVPNETDFNTLTTYLGGTSVAGGKLKEVGTTHWQSPNTDATNEVGFTALPSGYRNSSDGTYGGIGTLSYFWTTITNLVGTGVSRSMNNTTGTVTPYNNTQRIGLSVRCVRDVV